MSNAKVLINIGNAPHSDCGDWWVDPRYISQIRVVDDEVYGNPIFVEVAVGNNEREVVFSERTDSGTRERAEECKRWVFEQMPDAINDAS